MYVYVYLLLLLLPLLQIDIRRPTTGSSARHGENKYKGEEWRGEMCEKKSSKE